MLISKIHLPRRTVLKALGATVGLPLLDAMIPAGTALGRTAAAGRPCMSFIYFPHGAVMEHWTPRDDEALPSILAPLAPFRKQLTVVSGLENKSAIAPPVHAITPATWLSCTVPQVGKESHAGVTVDQVVASKLKQDTRFDSIQVATEAQGGEGSTDGTYGGTYAKTISVGAASTPLPMEHDPRKVFQQLFGPDDLTGAQGLGAKNPSATDLEHVVFTRRGSVLDLVRQDATDLSRKLGPSDRAVLEDYLANVRAIERRVQSFTLPPLHNATAEAQHDEAPTAFNGHIDLMFDLIALAYEANLTRVASLMMAAEVSNQPYDFIGIPDSFHALSHHGNSPAKLDKLAKVQAYNTELFAKFVNKLATTRDGDGSLLDHSLIVYGSNMSNSNLHDHTGLPLALIGGACGKLSGNRHVRCPDHTPLANLHVALLNKVAIPTTAFGDSTGELTTI
jgi:Protein of unknown function (DUF1552)